MIFTEIAHMICARRLEQLSRKSNLKGQKHSSFFADATRKAHFLEICISKCISDIIFPVYFCNVYRREKRVSRLRGRCGESWGEGELREGRGESGDGRTVRVSRTYERVYRCAAFPHLVAQHLCSRCPVILSHANRENP